MAKKWHFSGIFAVIANQKACDLSIHFAIFMFSTIL
tara:strand:- start:97 stop:204 length:108 start_codon:yes stop_codon:yes gene_type:complete